MAQGWVDRVIRHIGHRLAPCVSPHLLPHLCGPPPCSSITSLPSRSSSLFSPVLPHSPEPVPSSCYVATRMGVASPACCYPTQHHCSRCTLIFLLYICPPYPSHRRCSDYPKSIRHGIRQLSDIDLLADHIRLLPNVPILGVLCERK